MRLIRKALDAAWQWNNRPRLMTPAELVRLLQRMQADEATPAEWDYFQALAFSDVRLEAIRKTVAPLYGPGFAPSNDPTLATAIVRAKEIAGAEATDVR